MKLKKFSASLTAVVLGASIMFTGCGNKIDTEATLVNINGGEETISLGYGNFVAKYQQAVYDQYYMTYFGEDMWSSDIYGSGTTLEQDVKTAAVDGMKEQYVLSLHLDEYSVSLTDEEKAAIEAAADSFMASNNEETLELMSATREYVVKMLTDETLAYKMKEAVKDSADVNVTEEECWQRTFSYAFFSTTTAYDADGNSIEVTDEYVASQKEAAEKVAAATDFDAAAEESGATVSTYSYTKGTTEDASFGMDVISKAEAMNKGDISSVIEVSDVGYYVIRLDEEHDAEASETKKATLTSQQQAEFYNGIYEGWESAVTWELDEELWNTVTFKVLFKAVESEETEEAAN
ncbi:MAG: peptidyl-prolyl cis-trans isomerase [Pseudobutyrivibrio sp.]|nr:peptidyl-prolyl cis-trans isomerase [Pseudobutyrivibrio sp.]